ncbi:MAG: ABC-F family ATP-binding cassette domain-containing protein [Deinococcota bacterium]
MLLAALQQVDKYYGDQDVLMGATLELYTSSQLALIGRNGAGKSTILRLLMQQEQPDGGQVYVREGVQIAMLEQDPVMSQDVTIEAVSDQAFTELDALEQRLAELEQAGLDKPDIFETWERIHDIFERRGGYARRARRDAVLHALGFQGREHDLASQLSGGEKTRLGLAKLLMAQPDVLLLDEPTNHLDMAMRTWLEGYLGRYPGSVVIVSHDRSFLDGAVKTTAEIANATLRTFEGIPSAYREHRAAQLEIEAATRANQHKERERLAASAAQMKQWAGQNAKLHRRAKSMERKLERYETTMLADAESELGRPRFVFPCGSSGDIILQATHLAKRFSTKTLFEDVHLTVRAGERIAIVGPNGAGKTSFLRVLLGDQVSDNPQTHLRYGARVQIGYYDQALSGVNPDATLIEELIRMVGDSDAHNLLGRFLFPYDAQFKAIRDLSGGERARLALLKLTLGEYNVLVLDEPTNHLDVEMIEALEHALAVYEGTLILVSHDRKFIQTTTDLIWEIDGGKFQAYEGGWSYYQQKRASRRSENEHTAKASDGKLGASKPKQAAHKSPSKWQLERTLETLEQQISELEDRLEHVTTQLANPQTVDTSSIAELGHDHAQLEADLLTAMTAWDEATDQLAAKQAG